MITIKIYIWFKQNQHVLIFTAYIKTIWSQNICLGAKLTLNNYPLLFLIFYILLILTLLRRILFLLAEVFFEKLYGFFVFLNFIS